MEFILAIIGILATFYIAYIQKQRGRVRITIEIEQKLNDLNSSSHKHGYTSYENNNGDRTISVSILIQSNYTKPIKVNSFVIAIPRIQSTANFARMFSYMIDNVPLKVKRPKLPVDLLSGEKINQIQLTGREVALALENRGYNNLLKAMIGIFDENRNLYCSKIIEIPIDEWLKDRGKAVMSWA